MPNVGKFSYHKFVDRLKKEIGPTTRKDLIAENVASAGTISTLLRGATRPTDKFIEKFAEFKHKNNTRALDKLTADLKALRDQCEPTLTGCALDDLNSGALPHLDITSLNYQPFAGSDDSFFESVFFRFFDIAGLRFKKLPNRFSFQGSDANAHVVLSLFDSADRMFRLGRRFFRVPIRIGLGAVCLQQHQSDARSISRILSDPLRPPDQSPDVKVRPVVVEGEVGWIHCVKRLKFGGVDSGERALELEEKFDLETLATRLRVTELKSRPAIPVVVTDEYTSLLLYSHLSGDGCFVFPMNSRRASQDEKDVARRELPQYYCSLAIHRDDSAFGEFMRDALVQFLSTEIETTARSWLALAKALAKKLFDLPHLPCDTTQSAFVSEHGSNLYEARRWAYIWEWIFYTLSLDEESIVAFTSATYLPWQPILRRARQLVQQYLAEEKKMIVQLVDYLWVSPSGRDRLCRLLDLRPSREKDIRTINEHQGAVDAICGQLIESSPDRRIRALDYDPIGSPDPINQTAARNLMQSVRGMYRQKGHPESCTRIDREIEEIIAGTTLYGGKTGRIIFASSEDDPWVFIGGACVRALDTPACELRYLWINPSDRGHNAGSQVISRAVEIAKKAGCESIYAEVLKDELYRAAGLFNRCGFVDSGVLENGRTKFEYKLKYEPDFTV